MKFSTRAEYGLRAIVCLDKNRKIPVSLAAIAAAENLSLAYLEQLFACLKRAKMVKADKGAKGGYYLSRPAKKISALEIIEALEGTVAPFDCVGRKQKSGCSCHCRIHPVWQKLYGQIIKTLKSIKLSQII